jgi:hypothetical protein
MLWLKALAATMLLLCGFFRITLVEDDHDAPYVLADDSLLA